MVYSFNTVFQAAMNLHVNTLVENARRAREFSKHVLRQIVL
jgi:hypothetical protein